MKLRNMTSIYLLCGDEMLLLYRRGSRVANNTYISSAGGHFEPGELNDPHRCMLRELKEELTLEEAQLEDLRLRYVTQRLKNGEVRQIYYYFARIADKSLVEKSSEGSLQWFPLEEILSLPMPVTAKQMLEHYIAIGQHTDELYAGATTPDGMVFTELKEFEG
ncbi:MAG: NUDIX domain-containing protein [Oscillospiraceae bacterium]|nr:NUDIX domain-containing protein [Oscillospiraceae bacterium]